MLGRLAQPGEYTTCPPPRREGERRTDLKKTFFLVDFQEPHPLPIGSDSSWRRSGSSAGVLPSNAAGSLCDNQAAEPCGLLGVDAESLPFIKLKIAGGRYPIGAVALAHGGRGSRRTCG